QKEWVQKSISDERSPLTPVWHGALPEACLLKPMTIEPLFDVVTARPEQGVEDMRHWESVVSLLSCVGPSGPSIALRWFQFDDPELAAIASSHVASGYVESRPGPFNWSVQLPCDAVAEVIGALQAIPGLVRKLRVSLDRLSYCMQRYRLEDRVLE